MNLNLTKPIVFIDIETTGLDVKSDRIIDIALIKIKPDGTEETINELINPGISIPLEATEIHGIKDSDVLDKKDFKFHAQKIVEFINDCNLAGFNITRFDFPILQNELNRCGMKFPWNEKILDLQYLYHKLEPRNLSSAYIKYCNKELEKVHSSRSDAKACLEILDAQLEKHTDLPKDISELIEFYNPKDPNWIDSLGKFMWKNEKATFNFGTHQGKTIEEIYINNTDYLKWMKDADFLLDVKQIVIDALLGKFPKK